MVFGSTLLQEDMVKQYKELNQYTQFYQKLWAAFLQYPTNQALHEMKLRYLVFWNRGQHKNSPCTLLERTLLGTLNNCCRDESSRGWLIDLCIPVEEISVILGPSKGQAESSTLNRRTTQSILHFEITFVLLDGKKTWRRK